MTALATAAAAAPWPWVAGVRDRDGRRARVLPHGWVAEMTWRELVDQLHASTAADDAAHMVEQLGRLR